MWALRYERVVILVIDRAISSGLCIRRNDTGRFRRFAHLCCMQFHVILLCSCDMSIRDLYMGSVYRRLIVSRCVFIWLISV